MRDDTINILIGGEAGQGLVTVGLLASRSLIRAGFEVCVTQDYMSRIRGGHNVFVIRTGNRRISGPREGIDILVAMDRETVGLHREEMDQDGVILVDARTPSTEDASRLGIPYGELADKRIHENTVALGVLAGLLRLDLTVVEGVVRATFDRKGEATVDENLQVLRDSYAWMRGQDHPFGGLPARESAGPAGTVSRNKLMLNGNEGIVLGALAAGCNFCSFYPMTPATSVALGLIEKGRGLGVVVEQAEDEISAINMAIGASFAGGRPIVPTSGGGFALMTEGISLAGMIEQPVVIVLGMRPGPATGLPTRTEQADLPFALHAGHGEFPRAIYAPGSVEECVFLTHEAFFVAERFQGPVIVMTDQFLADSYRSVEPFDLDSLPEIPPPLTFIDDAGSYNRYAAAKDGVSPRLVPGFGPYLVVADSDEHYEDGHITEEGGVRTAMVEKRLRKGRGIAERVVSPSFLGDLGPDLLMVCWGSTLGPAEEAAARLRKDRKASQSARKVAVLHFSQVWPLRPDQFMQILENAGEVVSVEGNATGQFAGLIRQETGFHIARRVLRYDGRPFTPEYILAALDEA